MLEHFPDPYPDEVLYSVWARYSDHVHSPNKEGVFRELFGKKSTSTIVDLPCYLGYFFDQLPFGHSYTMNMLIDCHTLLPFYGPFLPQERLSLLREQMMTGIGWGIHALAGNLRAGIPSPFWLRYCPACVEEDRRRFGECYWHRLHQVFGVEICPVHKTFLEDSTIRARTSLTEFGFVSAERAIQTVRICDATSSPYFNVFMVIACEVQFLLEHRFEPQDIYFLHQQYRALIAQHGFTTPHGRVRFKDLLTAFTEYYSEDLLNVLRCTVRLQGPLDSEWLSRIVRLSQPNARKSVSRPLYHILTIHFLGSKLETFFLQESSLPLPFGEGPWPCLNPVCEHYRQRTILHYQVARTGQKGQVTGIFSCSCGYTYSRIGPDRSPDDAFHAGRTVVHGSVWDAKLKSLWFDGTVRQKEIAHCFGINRYTINRQARRLNLPVPRRNARPKIGGRRPRHQPKGLSRYRSQWLAIVREAPNASRGALRRKAKGIHTWLRRNDPEWLEANSPPKRKPGKPVVAASLKEKQPSRWKISSEKDALMAEAVRAGASNLCPGTGYPKRISKIRIFREILQVRWSLTGVAAPLTELAIQDVVETHEAFALRRIQWVFQRSLEEKVCPTSKQFIERAHLKRMLHLQSVQQALSEAMDKLSQLT